MQSFIFQASCKGEVEECHNGGAMIWHPVKSFACVCKDGYEGMFCQRGSIYLNCWALIRDEYLQSTISDLTEIERE